MLLDLTKDDEKSIYENLSQITDKQTEWPLFIPDVGALLPFPSNKIKAKALWLLGEMGLQYPSKVTPFIPPIVQLLQSGNDKVRERAVGALGRIGRANPEIITPYLEKILHMAHDSAPNVRMNFIWACENIATNAPSLFEGAMDIFSKLLEDTSVRVRIEAPEIFRVIGKRKPEYVTPYLPKLKQMAAEDGDRVVRIHSAGAVKAAKNDKLPIEAGE